MREMKEAEEVKKMKGLKEKALRLTERDVEILKFINGFGFCEMPQLDRRFGLKKPRNYQVMERLVEGGLVKHERVFYGRHGIYRLSNAGARLTELPALMRVPLSNYTHDITVMEAYLRLCEKYPDCSWVSARQLMQDKHLDGVGKRGHLPDGVLVFPDGKQVAIEVELTLKGRTRLERILKGYGTVFTFKEVWYYCSEGVAASMASMVAKLPFIKIHRLKELLGESLSVQ